MDRVRRLIHAEEIPYTGKGIGIAVLDTGISARHPDLRKSCVCFRDLSKGNREIREPYDDNGHGTHVAGILAGSGQKSNGRYRGIAPGSHLIVLKVLDQRGNGETMNVEHAIEWCVRYRQAYQIRILNISVGMLQSAKEQDQERLLHAVVHAWEAGIVVVSAAGNNGPQKNSVTIPGSCPEIITVGCSDSIEHADYSGCGPTRACVQKPEILAPGTDVFSCGNAGAWYQKRSGTSMATPVVSAAIALLLEKEPWMLPQDVKLRLYQTGRRIPTRPSYRTGWGEIDLIELLRI